MADGLSLMADGWRASTIASAPTATRPNCFIRTSEIQPDRELHDSRRTRRVADADRGAEVRVDLHAVGVEPRRAIDVLELDLVEQIVDLRAELRGAAAAEIHVLEDREVRVDEPRLAHDVARRVRAVGAARRPRERRRVEGPRLGIAVVGERIADEHRPHEVEARLAARQARARAGFAAGEVEAVARGERDVRPVAGDEIVLARDLPAVE